MRLKIDTETIFQKIRAVNIQNLMKDMNLTIEENQQAPSRINAEIQTKSLT